MRVTVRSAADWTEDVLSQVVDFPEYYTPAGLVLAMKTDIMKGLMNNGITDPNIPNLLNNISDDIYMELRDETGKKSQRELSCVSGVIINYIVAGLGMCGIYSSDIYSTVHGIVASMVYKVSGIHLD